MKTLAKLVLSLAVACATAAGFAKSKSTVITYGDGETLEAEDTLSFSVEGLPETIAGAEVLEEFLPDGIDVEWTGKKFKTPKSASPKVKKDKDTGDFDIVVSEKGEDNPCSLKVSFKAKTGIVSGSFKVFTAKEDKKGKPKLKSYSAKFSGKLGEELKVTIKKVSGSFTATLD